MKLTKAEDYLKDVLEHKRCIPYSRFDGSVGRTSAAIEFGLTKGRYPEKSVKLMLNLLQNAKSNAEAKKLNIEKLAIKNVLVNQAAEGRRRTYRAHGSINAYCSSNCHLFSKKSSNMSGRIYEISFFFFFFFFFFYSFFNFFTYYFNMAIRRTICIN